MINNAHTFYKIVPAVFLEKKKKTTKHLNGVTEAPEPAARHSAIQKCVLYSRNVFCGKCVHS